MDRRELKSRRVAAPGYGNARFLDEGDEPQADAVVFTPYAGAWMVYATDEAALPIEATRRSFGTDTEAFDYMHQCLRDKLAARHAEVSTLVEDAAYAEAQRGEPEQVVLRTLLTLDSYRELGVVGTLSTVAFLATAVGWLWISPFTYTREDLRYVDDEQRGTYVFDADSGLVVVAVCYSLAVVSMAVQWRRGRREGGRVARRARRIATGTAFFSLVALVCMLIRAGEVDNPLFWLPPVLALLSSAAVAVSLRRVPEERNRPMADPQAAAALIRALIENMRGAADDWESLAMVIDYDGGRFRGTHGYAYGPDGTPSAIASRPSAVRPYADEYLAGYFQSGDRLPLKLLVQFDRTKGQYEVTFEDTDAGRWKVTPSNINEISEELRPAFD